MTTTRRRPLRKTYRSRRTDWVYRGLIVVLYVVQALLTVPPLAGIIAATLTETLSQLR